ncbi:MAG TPA: hypothetical protein VE175_09475 [Woeseiaceae bacterium]|jgi:hypothetical protein|nr:hypothetical protein [Woeseiaceae bacterium]
MSEDGPATSVQWSRDTQKIAVLSWISFLSAALFSVVFFAFVDPLVLVDALDVQAIESRNAGYAVGFFFFWANGWIAAWLTTRLIRRKRRGPGAGRFPGAGA